MKVLVTSLLRAIPALVNVVILQILVFCIFGIVGIQLFGGELHARCRLTPFPVALPLNESFPPSRAYLAAILDDPQAHACVADDRKVLGDEPAEADPAQWNFNVAFDRPSWTSQSDSIWAQPQHCFWPLDDADVSLCSLSGSGYHHCRETDNDERSWCGSDYDALGNPRFARPDVMSWTLFSPDLNWGYTLFDTMPRAFLTIFQSITMEGWTDIMYQCQDTQEPVFAAVFFILLIVFGSFFVLNLTLAVLCDEFEIHDDDDKEDIGGAQGQQPPSPSSSTENGGLGLYKDKDEEDASTSRQSENNSDDSASQMSEGTTKDPEKRPFAEERVCPPLEQLNPSPQAWMPQLTPVVTHSLFDVCVMGIIVLNTLVLSSDHHPISDEWMHQTEVLSFVFSMIFVVEMVLKILGLGPQVYLQDSFNRFDLLVIGFSLVELVLVPPAFFYDDDDDDDVDNHHSGSSSSSSSSTFSTLRTFRLFRVFKLARNWTSLRNLLLLMVESIKGMINFGILLFLFMYIYALVGVQFFANRFRFDLETGQVSHGSGQSSSLSQVDVPRANFDDLLWAFVTIFQILTGENWNTVMYDGWRATGWFSTLYFVTLVIIGNFIVMNIFLALLLGNFEGNEDLKSTTKLPTIRKRMLSSTVVEPEEDATSTTTALEERERERPVTKKKTKTNPFRKACQGITCHRHFESLVLSLIFISSVALALDSPLNDPASSLALGLKHLDLVLTILFTLEMGIKITSVGLVFRGGGDSMSSSSTTTTTTPYLRNGWNILDAVIVISSILLIASEGNPTFKAFRSLRGLRTFRPLRMVSRQPGLKLIVNTLFKSVPSVLNVAFISILFFLIFAILGVNYLKGSFWACSFNSSSGDVSSDSHMFMNWIVTPELVAHNVSAVQARYCSSSSNDDVLALQLNARSLCQCLGGTWSRTIAQHFDHIGQAMLTLFELTTTEGWVDVMLAAVDQRGIDAQPQRNANEIWIVFFILFMLVGSFFVMNLFVGVVIDNFNQLKAELGADAFLTTEQQMWIKTQKRCREISPIRYIVAPREKALVVLGRQEKKGSSSRVQPEEGEETQLHSIPTTYEYYYAALRRSEWLPQSVFRLTYALAVRPYHQSFQLFVTISILCNTILMTFETFGQSDDAKFVLGLLNAVFASVFMMEMWIKILGLGWSNYWFSGWNRFDGAIVISTSVGYVLDVVTTGVDLGALSLLIRLCRMGRIMRLVKKCRGIQQIFITLYISLPGLSNVMGLLLLLLFIFSMMGMQLYAKVAIDGALSRHANFQTFGASMMTLLRSTTGENWNGLMHSLASQSDGCDPDPAYDPDMCGFGDARACTRPLNGCGSPSVYAFMVSFTLIVTYIMLNLSIAIILESFSESEDSSGDKTKTSDNENDFNEESLTPDELEQYINMWSRFDPLATGFITVRDMLELMKILPRPLGFPRNLTLGRKLKLLTRMRLQIYHGERVQFHEVLTAVAKRVMLILCRKRQDVQMEEMKFILEMFEHKGYGEQTIGRRRSINPFQTKAPTLVENTDIAQSVASAYIKDTVVAWCARRRALKAKALLEGEEEDERSSSSPSIKTGQETSLKLKDAESPVENKQKGNVISGTMSRYKKNKVHIMEQEEPDETSSDLPSNDDDVGSCV